MLCSVPFRVGRWAGAGLCISTEMVGRCRWHIYKKTLQWRRAAGRAVVCNVLNQCHENILPGKKVRRDFFPSVVIFIFHPLYICGRRFWTWNSLFLLVGAVAVGWGGVVRWCGSVWADSLLFYINKSHSWRQASPHPLEGACGASIASAAACQEGCASAWLPSTSNPQDRTGQRFWPSFLFVCHSVENRHQGKWNCVLDCSSWSRRINTTKLTIIGQVVRRNLRRPECRGQTTTTATTPTSWVCQTKLWTCLIVSFNWMRCYHEDYETFQSIFRGF